jgi:hypothetical protein
MPQPNLIHPVDVVLQQISRATSIMDDDYREPVQMAARDTKKTLQGQVSWRTKGSLQQGYTGPAADASGYVLFLNVDLTRESITIKREDRFTSMGGVDTDVYVVATRPCGHYPGLGATMLKCFFADRSPTRNSPGGYD